MRLYFVNSVLQKNIQSYRECGTTKLIYTGSSEEGVLYHAKLIDLFKEAISAPGVKRFSNLQFNFDLNKSLRQNIIRTQDGWPTWDAL